jgi:hypothetical protein
MNPIKRSLRARRAAGGVTGALLGLVLLGGMVVGVQQALDGDAAAEPATDLNWARHARTTMSPAAGATATAGALAIDGDPSTSAVTGSRIGIQPFVQLDLESATRITTIRVLSPSSSLTLLTGDERGIPGTTIAQATGAPGVTVTPLGRTAAGAVVRVDADIRYIRVQGNVAGTINALASTSISVAEVEAITDAGYVYALDPGPQSLTAGAVLELPMTAYSPGPVTWTARGLPRGFTIDASDGRITGATTVTGRWPVEITATDDATRRSHTAKFDIVVSPGAPSGAVQEHPSLDPATLANRPTPAWGVIGTNASTRISGGNPTDSTPSLDVTVWDMHQLGDWMYVGGEFDRVMAPDGTTHPQRHLARFSVATGVWDHTWRPALDGNVHALEVNDRGRLLVGGEFTTIDGVPGTAAIAAIDPTTGTVDPAFTARAERRFSTARPIVRELEVVGPHVYVAGKFSHIANGDRSTRAYNAARLGNAYGTVDPTWQPRVMGGSVWGIGVDQANGLVHLNGWFSSVEGQPNTNRLATVSTLTGELATTARTARNSGQVDVYDVEAAGGAVWMAGSEHVLVRMDPLTRGILSWNAAGYRNPQDYPATWQGNGLGGDFQFAEKIGDFVYAGCHCNRKRSDAHWSSVTRRFSNHIVANAYRVADGGLVEEWNADVGGGIDGAFTAASDTRGCLWIGGDIVDGGFYEPGGRVFARGFARFCTVGAPVAPASLSATSPDATVTLEWTQPVGATVAATLVYRDGERIGRVTDGSRTYVDATVVDGATHAYEVRNEDDRGRTSAGNPTTTITVGESDLQPPTVPNGLTADVGEDSVVLRWETSTDNRALSGYLVYRDGAYLGFTPAVTWTDAGLPPGSHRYTVRSVDAAGNRSDLSPALTVAVGGPDTTAPSVPTGLTPTAGPDSATLAWDPSTDDRAVTGYLVYRDGAYAGFAAGTTWTDEGLAPGTYTYDLRAVDAAENRSARSGPVTVQVGGADTTPPTVPTDLTASVAGGSVTLTWTPSSDDRAVTSYLVYRNGAYVGWSPTTTWTDTGVPAGTWHYDLRAVDAAGNRSGKSPPVTATVG